MAREEHHELVAIEMSDQAIHAALNDPVLTPVAAGTLLLWGRSQWGDAWMHHSCRDIVHKTTASPE